MGEDIVTLRLAGGHKRRSGFNDLCWRHASLFLIFHKLVKRLDLLDELNKGVHGGVSVFLQQSVLLGLQLLQSCLQGAATLRCILVVSLDGLSLRDEPTNAILGKKKR